MTIAIESEPTSGAQPPDGLRILYLANGFPWPLTSGYLRHYFLIRELARRGHRISLLTIVPSGFEPADRAELEPFTERIVTVDSHRRTRSFRRRAQRRIESASIGETAARRLRDEVETIVATVPHDVALFSGRRTYPALGAVTGMPIVADVCDATSSRVRGNLRYASIARLPLLLAEYIEVSRVERALVRDSVRSLFASVRDRDALLPPEDRDRATILPNGVDLDVWRRPAGAPLGRGEIVFTGAMDYPPNTDAALYLIGEVLPRVRADLPTAHLSIVGRDPTDRLIAAGRASGVTVTGLVDDVRPYLVAASVFAAPLRFGAGIQNKVLEALAMGVPTVASANGSAGLITDEGIRPPLTVASPKDPAAFAAAIVDQLRAVESDPTPHVDGRTFVERHFTWTRSGELLEAALREAVAAGARSRAG